MTEHSFDLIPFPSTELPEINIRGRIAREQDIMSVNYVLAGDLNSIYFPNPVSQPARREELWLETCFEFFLAIPGQPQYWEFNLSPSRDWNAFSMDAYRRIGFRQENRIENPNIAIEKNRDCFHLGAVVDLEAIIPMETPMQAAITSVIRTLEGNESYWALLHPGPDADFHLRQSFVLSL